MEVRQAIEESPSVAITLPPGQKPIIFFDGVCGMCNALVDYLMRIDRQQQFMFAPLQGRTAQELLPPQPEDPQAWSLIYLDEEGLHDQFWACMKICRRVGGVYKVLSLFRIIPRPMGNALYRLVGRNRYRIFGKKEACRLPTPQERARFLP
jgi:predicted DCC family thiol-disulfide oxidoreductase YuxK